MLAHKRHTLAMTDIDWLVAVPEPVRVTGHGVESHLSVARAVNRKVLAVGDILIQCTLHVCSGGVYCGTRW